jgi:hypothetical protein
MHQVCLMYQNLWEMDMLRTRMLMLKDSKTRLFMPPSCLKYMETVFASVLETELGCIWNTSKAQKIYIHRAK